MDALGFSVECYPTKEHDENGYKVIDEFEGCGCAILWKACAAFEDTFIEKIAASHAVRSDAKMTKEEKDALVKEISAAVVNGFDERLDAIANAQAEIKAEMDKTKSDNNFDAKSAIDSLAASIEDIKAQIAEAKAELDTQKATKAAEDASADEQIEAEKIPEPKAGQHVEKSLFADSKDADIEKINASSMSAMDKLKQITKLRMQHD